MYTSNHTCTGRGINLASIKNKKLRMQDVLGTYLSFGVFVGLDCDNANADSLTIMK